MSRLALYQKYRSNDFDEVVGQEYVVRSVRNALRTGKVGHAYLFCGPRGTGKTTMARLLAKAVNCENPAEAPCGHCASCLSANEGTHPDIVEINAANETHVEDIRDLIDRARLSPMMGKHKIYIIDEVHQLSSSAASALLKTLEEPPSHVIFILATTDPQKLLPTIVSRCQRFDFSKVNKDQIRDHLLNIAEKEGFRLDAPAAEKIAELADGGMRDALSILEQTVSYGQGEITEEDINQIYGLASASQKIELLTFIQKGDLSSVIERIRAYEQRGIDLERMNSELIDILRDTVIYKTTKKESLLRVLNAQQAQKAGEDSTAGGLMKMIDALMKALDTYRVSQSAASCFEIACMNMMVMNEPETQTQTVRTSKKEEPVREQPAEHTPPTVMQNAAEPEDIPAPVMEKPAVPEEKQLNTAEILNLLLQSDKVSKSEDIAKLQSLMTGMQVDRCAVNLRSTVIAASGKDCILFVSKMPSIVTRMNEPEYNRELYEYLRDRYRIDKMPFAADQETYDTAVQEFIRRRKDGTLPAIVPVYKYKEEAVSDETENMNDPVTRLTGLFGKDLVEVIEDGGRN